MNSASSASLVPLDFWVLMREFWSFQDANVLWVVVGSMLLGIAASVVGSFAFLRKRSLMGDVLAHAALPGVMTAFLLAQTNTPWVMFVGALSSSFLGLLLMDWIPKNSKIKPDAAMAITLSFFFALGLMELSYIQGLEIEGKSGLDKMLFGQAAAMLPKDIAWLSGVAVLILVTIGLFFHKFRLIAFNRVYAQTLGLNLAFYELILALLIVSAVVIGLQVVGVVLMAAVLLTPIAAARFWSQRLSHLLWIAAIIGGLSGLISANISYMAPAMPTGPWMVVVLSLFFLVSFLFAPERGLVANARALKRLRQQVQEENVLRTFYVLNERHPSHHADQALHLDKRFHQEDILANRAMSVSVLKRTLHRLVNKGWVEQTPFSITLTPAGAQEASQLTRRHRLWENYLIEQASIDSSQVHLQAEHIEHLLTDVETREIEQTLSGASHDPHGKTIPSAVGVTLEKPHA
ncbi:iron chelate uptake ABC transporter family permease subunit [Thiosulfativibrio zosterae]|nr:iron chelate uptake ABC transporter family permease subunit [Thiosulfativibrio zosterae]